MNLRMNASLYLLQRSYIEPDRFSWSNYTGRYGGFVG